MNTSNRINELADKIKQARNDYYNHQAKVSDQIFDAWSDELKKLDPNNLALTAIGAPIIPSEWKKAAHRFEMGSLDKVNTPEELSDWLKDKNISQGLFITEKLDGISINCVYEDGNLIQAINGVEGEDILSNVKQMRGVKQNIKNFTGSLRGEIVMFKSIHQEYFIDKANPRNAASGISKRLDGVGSDKLNAMFYQVVSDLDFKTEQEQFDWLKKNEISIPNHWYFKTVKEANNHWREYQDQCRDKLDYDLDGLVIAVNDLEYQISLGSTNSRRKGVKAFKFDNEMRETIVEAIVYQTGSQGRLTPVATVKEVVIGGAKVSRASIYNYSYIEELQLDVGAKVLITRANDVIPRLEELIEGTGTLFPKPEKCSECNGKVKEDGEYFVCTNTQNCPAQKLGRFSTWVAELNLLEWGDKVLNRLIEANKVNDISDLYKLTVEDLAGLERMGKKSAQKCYDILWNAKEVSLDLFLGGLSIPMIGASTIKLIMGAGYDNLDKIQQLKVEDLEKIQGLGPVKAKSLVQGLTDNQVLITNLLANGIKIKEKIMGKLTGKSFCFSGAMSHKRNELEEMVIDEGGEVKNSVGKTLTFLVLADATSVSSKAQKARQAGTQVISEQEFLDLLE